MHDLVGAVVQQHVLRMMRMELDRSRHHGFPSSCLYIQVDGLGENAAPQLIEETRRALVELVREKTRGRDHVSGMGRQGVVMLLCHADASQAVGVAERIAARFARIDFERAIGSSPTVSIGVAALEEGAPTVEDLVARAESALRDAIRRGGDRIALYGLVDPRGSVENGLG